MAYSRIQAIQHAWRLLKDVGADATSQQLTDTELGAFIDQAAKEYSFDKPLSKVEDVTANGTSITALPSGWVSDFSAILGIETPPGTLPPNFADPRSFQLYQTPTGYQVQWFVGSPGLNDVVRFTYTALRTFDDNSPSTSTVADVDFEAVCALAAAIGSQAIAAKYASKFAPNVNADTQQTRTKTQDWQAIARQMMAIYTTHMAKSSEPASGSLNWDIRLQVGYDNLTHTRWRR